MVLCGAREKAHFSAAGTRHPRLAVFHALRHYFCSKLVRCGASVEAVRVMAGHSTLAITQRYVHAASADLRAVIVKLSSAGP